MYWVPGVFLGLLELAQRETGKPIDMPVWVFWLVFGVGLLFASFLAFHDLRRATAPEATKGARRQVENEIAQIINEGSVMAADSWPNIAFSEQEAWESATTWWNGAGVFIEAVLGPGERHLISEPLSGSGREDLLEKHCNLLRGVLTRLPSADLQIEGEELADAIAARQETGYPQNRKVT